MLLFASNISSLTQGSTENKNLALFTSKTLRVQARWCLSGTYVLSRDKKCSQPCTVFSRKLGQTQHTQFVLRNHALQAQPTD